MTPLKRLMRCLALLDANSIWRLNAFQNINHFREQVKVIEFSINWS